MNLVALKAEIESDPEEIGYAEHLASGSDQNLANLLNAETRPGWRDLTVGEITGYALLSGAWDGIEAAAASETESTLRTVARRAIKLFTTPTIQTVEMSDATKRAAFLAMLDMLTTGAITQDHKAELLALSQINISRAKELGFSPISHEHVAQALRG